jgi:hypothetical protein
MASCSGAKQPGARVSGRRGTDGGCPQGDSSHKLEDLNLAEAMRLVKQGAKFGGMNAVK